MSRMMGQVKFTAAQARQFTEDRSWVSMSAIRHAIRIAVERGDFSVTLDVKRGIKREDWDTLTEEGYNIENVEDLTVGLNLKKISW